MLGALHAPITKLQEFNLALYLLLILLAPIVNTLAFLAREFDKSFLGHEISV